MIIEQRKPWNENHKKLKSIILKPEEHSRAVQLSLALHAFLHHSSISQNPQETLFENVLQNLTEANFREYPVNNPDTKNSIVWHLWHITRIEDMTMNILCANRQQVFNNYWLESLNIPFTHSGNDMSKEEIALLSSTIDIHSLLAYREAVGRKTQEIISSLTPGQFRLRIEQDRVKRLFDEKAVLPNSSWLAEYWSKKTIAGLILMPGTRHIFLHLNKSMRIKDKLQKLG